MSMPYRGTEFNFTQPDGTELRVRGWGNQYNAVFEAMNGYTVVEDPATGFYEYARVNEQQDALEPVGARPRHGQSERMGVAPGVRVSPEAFKAAAMESSKLPRGRSRWEQRRKQSREILRSTIARPGLVLAPPQRQTVGTFVGLCLLIEFPDVPGTITQAEVADFCNKPGYSGFGNKGSVRDYFLEISRGKLDYSNVVTPYYTAKNPRKYYTDEKVAQPTRARALIKEALGHWKAQGFDFSALTADNDGYIYATNVFYSGTRVNNWSKGLWPHAYHLMTPYALAQGTSAFDYQITDMTGELSLGTFCHENGHMICDFPDLYDYGSESAGVGEFCLMCAGGIADPKNPTHVAAYLKYRAGWATSLVNITEGIHGTAKAGTNEFFIHRKNASEYFIVENRQKAGRDKALPDSGLAVWHVDELGDNQNEQMTAQQHYECSLVQADGKFDLERDPRNEGDAGDLFAAGSGFGPATQPHSRWWDGSDSRLALQVTGGSAAALQFSGTA